MKNNFIKSILVFGIILNLGIVKSVRASVVSERVFPWNPTLPSLFLGEGHFDRIKNDVISLENSLQKRTRHGIINVALSMGSVILAGTGIAVAIKKKKPFGMIIALAGILSIPLIKLLRAEYKKELNNEIDANKRTLRIEVGQLKLFTEEYKIIGEKAVETANQLGRDVASLRKLRQRPLVQYYDNDFLQFKAITNLRMERVKSALRERENVE